MLKGQKFDHVSAAWLADAIQTKCNEEYERQDEGLERELAVSGCFPCPTCVLIFDFLERLSTSKSSKFPSGSNQRRAITTKTDKPNRTINSMGCSCVWDRPFACWPTIFGSYTCLSSHNVLNRGPK